MLKKIAISLLAIIIVILVIAAFQPDDFKVSRSMPISALVSAVFPHVNNLHAWEAWSPWANPKYKTVFQYQGPSSGKGAVVAWAGNRDVGEGRMTIVESIPNELIRIKLDFEKPFKDTSHVEFTFEPEERQTVVTWSMAGRKCYLAKVMGLFINCDRMIGNQFDKGLTQLKTVVEAGK